MTNEFFIKWAMAKCKNPKEFKRIKRHCMAEIVSYFQTSDDALLKHLQKKLIKGGKDHGSPDAQPWDVLKELRDEYIDIIGWTLVGMFNDEYKDNRTSKK